jgi:hypothetical protein
MEPIIAGTFESFTEAETFVESLLNANFSKDDISIIAVESSESDSAPSANSQASHNWRPYRRMCGSLVAIHAEENGEILTVALMLKRSGAKAVEWAIGSWQNGRWVDFTPQTSPRLIGEIDDALVKLLS